MKPAVLALVLLAAALHASWNALLKGGRDRLWSGTAQSFFGASACLLLLPLLPLPQSACWPYLLASVALHVLYNLLLVRMYSRGHFGVTYPVARGSSPLLVALGGALFSSELLAPVQLTGILLVCGGIACLARGLESIHRESIPPALATGVMIAAYSLIDGLGARHGGSAVSYTVWMMMFQGLGMAGVFLMIRRQSRDGLLGGRTRQDLAQALAAGVISVTAYAIVVWAMKQSPMGIVSALRETSVLFAAVLAWLFLNESLTGRKLIGAMLIGAGALCLH